MEVFFINKVLTFIKNNVFLIASILGITVIGFLFLPIFNVKTSDNQELTINIISYFQNGTNFAWTMILTLSVLISAITLTFLSKRYKDLLGISTFLFILATIFLALAKSFYKMNENISKVYIQYGLILALVFSSLASIIATSVSYINSENSVRDLAEEGMLVAMAFVLNLIKLFEAPGGGSVNLQMLPLFVLALRHGPINGLICGGLVYGMITCLTDGWGILFYPFDYLIGFGSIAILGLFRNLILNGNTKYNWKSILFLVIGVIASSAVRFVGGVTSSIVCVYTDDAFGDALVKALIYNSPYIFISAGIALIAIVALYPVIAKINERYPVKGLMKL